MAKEYARLLKTPSKSPPKSAAASVLMARPPPLIDHVKVYLIGLPLALLFALGRGRTGFEGSAVA
jgi:hypothetical protein